MEVARMRSDMPVFAFARLAAAMESRGVRWVVGGSTGLVLRGAVLDRAPRDLDIYIDGDKVSLVHEELFSFALDSPMDNETDRYHSILSHYRIGETMVELVGNFRVAALQSSYITEVSDFLFPNSDRVSVEGYEIPLVPLGHELLFNLLRERKDRAAAAGSLISQAPEKHLPLLQALIQRNEISPEVAADAWLMANGDSRPSPLQRKEPL